MKKYIFFILIIVFLFSINKINNFFPLKYTEKVEYYSEKFDLDRVLVYSIIKVESNFREKVVSPKGAVGLMQVMPSTAAWILEVNNYDIEDYDLYVARDNIFIACLYLSYLHDRFDNDLKKVSAAYNGGSSRIENQVWKEIEETRNYVKKVKIAYFFYKYKIKIIEVFQWLD